jgi:hypothetical protein
MQLIEMAIRRNRRDDRCGGLSPSFINSTPERRTEPRAQYTTFASSIFRSCDSSS